MLKKKLDPLPPPQSASQNLPPPEEVADNPFVNMYEAVKRAIMTLHDDPENECSPLFFKSIAIDTGQFERLIREVNTEFETAFPAVFIHFVNVRYLVQQQRIGEGRATMRIRFILNTLNHQDPARECDPFVVFQRLNQAIQDAKNHEPALNERCNLTYFDMPMTCNFLQAYWIDYEVWFRESSSWKYRDWVERYLVIPPFTNHSDADAAHNESGHADHIEPAYKKVTGFVPSVEKPDDPEKDNPTEF